MSEVKTYRVFNKIFLSIDHTLEPFDRFIFFRLWLLGQGDEQQDYLELNDLVEKLNLGRGKLKKSLLVLSKKGLVSLQGDDQIIINNLCDLPLRRKCQLFEFDTFLISNIDKCRYHHKQKAIENYWNLDYKAWLVLFSLVLHSDRHGIVIKIGMHEFNIFTGMDRYSIQRTLKKLFDFGILRSKINGSLDNKYLSFTSPIYFLNLSHPIWGKARKYQKFSFVSLPERSIQVDDVFFNLDGMQRILGNILTPKINKALVFDHGLKKYEFQSVIGLDEILIEFGRIIEQYNDIDLMLNCLNEDKEVKLKYTDNKSNNLKRLEFVLKYIVKDLLIKVKDTIPAYELSDMDGAFRYGQIFNLSKYLNLMDMKIQSTNTSLSSDDIQALRIQETKIYAFICKYLMKFEALALLEGNGLWNKLVPTPTTNNCQMNGYLFPQQMTENELHEITFEQEGGKLYKKIVKNIEMTLENQKKYGLLHATCEDLVF